MSLAEVVVHESREEGRESRVGGSARTDRAQIDALPVIDRNYSGLAPLSPLVTTPGLLVRATGSDCKTPLSGGVGTKTRSKGCRGP